jgi:hypothetical protein
MSPMVQASVVQSIPQSPAYVRIDFDGGQRVS